MICVLFITGWVVLACLLLYLTGQLRKKDEEIRLLHKLRWEDFEEIEKLKQLKSIVEAIETINQSRTDNP